MFELRERWIEIGCFLTGYNYFILRNCSEVSKKAVKKYTAAMIIMCLLWGMIGYSFANRYLHAAVGVSLACSLLFVIVIIQIERQIIMQTSKNSPLLIFRGVIAVMMALIGSIIIDQIIFKDDIELEKEQFINHKVEKIYPDRAQIRQRQIDELKIQLNEKDSQRIALNKSIQDHPLLNTNHRSIVRNDTKKPNGQNNGSSKTTTNEFSQIANPNINLIAPLDSQINSLQRLILSQSDSLANLRVSIERTLKEKTGFLDELNIMFSLLGRSAPALIVYIIWFLLLLGLECFILMNKRHEKPTDYDAMIAHQMDIHIKKLSILSSAG